MPDKRLIDANALMKNIGKIPQLRGITYGRMKKAVEETPTINAVEVVHGRWVHNDLGHTYCSKCHERLPFMHCYTEEPCSDYDEEWDEEIPETRYCPNCGAKMGGHNDTD